MLPTPDPAFRKGLAWMLGGLSVQLLGIISVLLIPIMGQNLGAVCGLVGLVLGGSGVIAAFVGSVMLTQRGGTAANPPPW